MMALQRQPTRRLLVLAVLAVCALLISQVPLHGLGPPAAVALAALDIALVAATGGLTFVRRGSLDERQAARRDLAYRRGFRLLGLGLVLLFAASILGSWITAAQQAATTGPPQVDSGIGGHLLIAVLELMVMTPTLVAAWSEPDRADDLAPGGPGLGLLVPSSLTALAVAAAWLLAVGWAPAQAAGPSRSVSVGLDLTGSTCRHFATGQVVGAGFGATVGMRVEVCWNGRQAFVVGDPDVPLPAGIIGPTDDPLLTACGLDDREDFSTVSGTTCTARTDDDGTLHYSVRSRVAPLPLSIGAREVRMDLVVARSGAVLRQP